MSKECDIVKDLLCSNLEDDLSDSSKDFIKEHIKNCNDCKRIVEEFKKEKEENKKEETKENVKKIDYLKKYNKNINLLKITSIILVIGIVLMWSFTLITYNKNKAEYEYKYSIITSINRPNEESDKYNNFKCFAEKTAFGRKEYIYQYYKDGNFKYYRNEFEYVKENNEYKKSTTDYKEITGYGQKSDSGKLSIMEVDKKDDKINYRSGYQGEKVGFYDLTYGRIANYIIAGSSLNDDWNSIGIETYKELNIREDNYDGKDCYVIKRWKNDGGYFEVWIDKSNMTIVKVNEDEDFVITYKWEINTVTDEDLMVDDKEAVKDFLQENDWIYDDKYGWSKDVRKYFEKYLY